MRSFITCTLRHILLDNQIKEGEMSRSCSTHREMENAYKVLVEKINSKRQLRTPKFTWENNIKIDL